MSSSGKLRLTFIPVSYRGRIISSSQNTAGSASRFALSLLGHKVSGRVNAVLVRKFTFTDSCQQFTSINVQDHRKSNDRVQFGVALAALNFSVVREMHPGKVCDLLLAEPEPVPRDTEPFTEKA
jgi:hypothetical protein